MQGCEAPCDVERAGPGWPLDATLAPGSLLSEPQDVHASSLLETQAGESRFCSLDEYMFLLLRNNWFGRVLKFSLVVPMA